MTVPSNSELNMYDGTPFDQTDWDSNFNQIITWLTSGNYEMTFNTVSATTYVGLPTNAFTLVAGEDLTAGDILRESGGQAYKASNATSSGITKVIGVAAATTSAAGTVTINYDYFSSFSGLTVGTKYYVGVDGAITSTKPQDYPFEVGLAVSTTRINFKFQEDSTPAGTVIPFSLASAPEGYILCNDANISRTTHARLFSVIGTTYGVGDGATTFGLPELRGEFVRGLDLSRGVDTGRAIGTTQSDATAVNGLVNTGVGGHTHSNLFQSDGYTIYGFDYPYAVDYFASGTRQNINTSSAGAHTHAITGDSETRPTNVALAYCIKL